MVVVMVSGGGGQWRGDAAATSLRAVLTQQSPQGGGCWEGTRAGGRKGEETTTYCRKKILPR